MAKLITDIVAVQGASKFTELFVRAAEKVLEDNLTAIVYTDAEILFLINEELPPEHQISEGTFYSWKAMIRENEYDNLPETAKIFYKTLLRYTLIQKRELFAHFQKDIQWQKWAWIIERKFSEWNIRHQMDIKGNIIDKKALVDYSQEELDEEIKKLSSQLCIVETA